MQKLDDTLSVCHICYRHVPAVKFKRDGSIYLGKTCKVHGYSEHLVEPDSEFYLNYKYPRRPLECYLLEVTNRCNLDCPHCYQMPDSKSQDPSIEYLCDLVKSWPDNGNAIALCGAEPTVRKDLAELMRAIRNSGTRHRTIIVLSNGVNLARDEYVQEFNDIPDLKWTIGLNHPDYQGHTVRAKQIAGIHNLKKHGYDIKNISYTLENLLQMEYCLDEIQDFAKQELAPQFRIRCGAEIGRYPDEPKLFMSDLMREVYRIAELRNWTVEYVNGGYGNRAHYPIRINGVFVKIIQWPDATTLDLHEVQTESLADILPGKPPSPLVHQVILRDGAINKGLMLYDTIPQEYIDNYGNQRD